MAWNIIYRDAPQSPITIRQQSSTLVQTTTVNSWTPSNLTLPGVLANNGVLAHGGWWDGNVNTGGSQNVPSNSNGTFLKAGNAAPNLPNTTPPPGWPVAPEIAHILSANAGNHVITPQNIDFSGDGYFFALELNVPAGKTLTLIDSAYAFAGSGTAGGVDGVTVATTNGLAQAGDFIIVNATLDGDPTSTGIGKPTTNAGSWNELLQTSTSAIAIAMGVAWQYSDGTPNPSATWTIADNTCEIFNAVMCIYRPV